MRLTSFAFMGWSLLYALPHLYWGLGGTFGFFAFKPSATEEDIWEAANLFAFALIALAGGIGFALEQAWRRPALRLLLLVIAGAGAALAASHGIYGILFRAASVVGMSDVDGVPFNVDDHQWVLWDMLAIEPWFLVEGILIGLIGYSVQTSKAGRKLWVGLVGAAFLFAFATGALGVKVG